MLLRQYDLVAVEEEPVTAQQVKDAARIDGLEFDLLLEGNIKAARRVAEHRTGRLLAARTVRAEFDDWPACSDRLAIVPAGAVSVTYWDGSAWQTLSTGLYAAVTRSNGLTVEALSTATWPTLGDLPGARVRVDVVVEPEPDEAANVFIIAQAAYWTQNPSAAGDRKQEASPFLQHLLDACSVYG